MSVFSAYQYIPAMLNDLYLSFHVIMHRFETFPENESFKGDTSLEIAIISSEKRNFQMPSFIDLKRDGRCFSWFKNRNLAPFYVFAGHVMLSSDASIKCFVRISILRSKAFLELKGTRKMIEVNKNVLGETNYFFCI